MLSLLGTILGILTGAIPELLKFFKQKQDQKHELEILKLQMQAQAQGHTERLEEINAEADIKESEALYKYAEIKPIPMIGNKVVDIITGLCNSLIFLLNGLVRSVVTFCFVAFYGLIKYGQYQALMETVKETDKLSPYYQSSLTILTQIWTETDHAVFSTILGHWFGQRMMRWSIEHYTNKK
jgi:uncharacterized membrane protein (GlpM family)